MKIKNATGKQISKRENIPSITNSIACCVCLQTIWRQKSFESAACLDVTQPYFRVKSACQDEASV